MGLMVGCRGERPLARAGLMGGGMGWSRRIISAIGLTALGIPNLALMPASAQQFAPYCQQTLQAITDKELLRQAVQRKEKDAEKRYRDLVADHARQIQTCRRQNSFQRQGIWLRLYDCDTRAGRIEEVLDRIVERGYNEVYVETFFNGSVLLPKGDNPTAWESAIQVRGQDQRDLLAEVIQKGRERGLKVHAWMFSLNFGYNYAIRPEKQALLIRNGRGQTSIQTENSPGLGTELGAVNPKEAFVDPYHPIARQDYQQMIQEVLKRKPDGIYFDYIRYPRLQGRSAYMSQVRDLWVYGEASRSALLNRAQNAKGREVIQRYLDNQKITATDLEAIDRLYPREASQPPLWQGRNPVVGENQLAPRDRQTLLSRELWGLAVAHSYQGVVDFLTLAVAPAQQQGIATGAVFFSDGNNQQGQTFDSRLQPWDRFPASVEFHPMTYANSGRVSDVMTQVQRVVRLAPPGAKIYPVFAGIWQQTINGHPPLEQKMQSLREVAPQIDGVSHFAYSWQEPMSDRDRKLCRSTLPPVKP
jgi:Glycosyl hydrolase-like 10